MIKNKVFLLVCLLFLIFAFNCKQESDSMEKGVIELINGQKITCYSLTREEFNNNKIENSVPLSEFNKFSLKVYNAKEGKIVVEENNYYTLYDNIDDLKAVVDTLFQNSEGQSSLSQEVLFGLNPYGKDFPKNTRKLIQNLYDTISLKLDVNDIGRESLLEVDKKIVSSNPELYERCFLNAIALVGEALNKKYGSNWLMELANDKQTWNTFLYLNNQKIVFHVYLYEDIFIEPGKSETTLTEIYDTISEIIERNILKSKRS